MRTFTHGDEKWTQLGGPTYLVKKSTTHALPTIVITNQGRPVFNLVFYGVSSENLLIQHIETWRHKSGQ